MILSNSKRGTMHQNILQKVYILPLMLKWWGVDIIDLKKLLSHIIKFNCSEYIKNFSKIKITSALFDEDHKEEWKKSDYAQRRILHFGEIIDKGLEVAEKASELGEENLNLAKEIYLKCMSDEKNKKAYKFTSPDEYGFEKALSYEKQDNN